MTKSAKQSGGLYNRGGKTPKERASSDQRIFVVNPYRFARMKYTMYVDADQIVQKSMGNDRDEKILAFQMMTDPRVAPFTDQEAVVNDFVIDEFSDGDPDRYKKKGDMQDPNAMLQAIMGGQGGQQNVAPIQPAQSLPSLT